MFDKLVLVVFGFIVCGVLLLTGCASGYQSQNFPMAGEEAEKYLEALSPINNILKDRGKACALFERLTQQYPNSHYAPFYHETVTLLKQMINEDKNWKEPQDISKLSLEDKINYYIYELRNTDSCKAKGTDRYVNFVYQYPEDSPIKKLIEIGEPAIPFLKKLYNDKRPIMGISTGVPRIQELLKPNDTIGKDEYPTLPSYIYRYQDAAKEIITAIKTVKPTENK